jgi:carbamoyl-phosphate synthase large subunit
VLIDRYLENAPELDVDLVCDGETVAIAGVLAHIEEAGVHSGDSFAVFPPLGIPGGVLATVKEHSRRLAFELGVRGLLNLQWAIKDGVPYCLEANPRASRTVPFISKATGVNWASVAARIGLGVSLAEQGVVDGHPLAIAVKGVVFPFAKFPGVDPVLGPEMRSTGEVMGVAATFGEAFAKAQLAAGQVLPTGGTVFFSVNDPDKPAAVELARRYVHLGFKIVATEGTANVLEKSGISVERVFKVKEGRPNCVDLIKGDRIQLIVNTPRGQDTFFDEKAIRRAAVMARIPTITTIAAAQAAAEGIHAMQRRHTTVYALQQLHATIVA